MLRTSAVSAFLLATGLALSFAAPVMAQATTGQASPQAMRAILTDRNNTTVIVKFIMKGDDGGGEEKEIFGTMIEPTGLVLVSNYNMGGMEVRYGGGVPSDIKVLVGDDTKGVEAKLVARDTELDLAWVQVNTAPEKPYAALDVSGAAQTVEVGDFVYTVTRSSKFYDRAPIVREIRVLGHATKPRKLFLVGTESFNGFGMPVYNADNKCVGVTALILPSEEEMENSSELFGDFPPIAVLPMKDVSKATQQAKETAASAPKAEPAAESGPAPAAEPAKDEAAPKAEEAPAKP